MTPPKKTKQQWYIRCRLSLNLKTKPTRGFSTIPFENLPNADVPEFSLRLSCKPTLFFSPTPPPGTSPQKKKLAGFQQGISWNDPYKPSILWLPFGNPTKTGSFNQHPEGSFFASRTSRKHRGHQKAEPRASRENRLASGQLRGAAPLAAAPRAIASEAKPPVPTNGLVFVRSPRNRPANML